MKTDNITLVVEAKDGRPLRTYMHEGKTFIESRESSEYSLRVKNKTGKRVMAVIAVDGINVISGKPATDGPNESGYILGPYEEHVIKGYRISEDNVASFKFVKQRESYAQEKGNGTACGVIGVRVWGEKNSLLAGYITTERTNITQYPPYPWQDSYPWWQTVPHGTWTAPSWSVTTFSTASASKTIPTGRAMDFGTTCRADNIVGATNTMGLGSAYATTTQSFNNNIVMNCCTVADSCSNSAFQHGSSWGSEVKDSVRTVTFTPDTVIEEVSIYYAPREGLKLLGIDVEKTKAISLPEPFKREFCSPPRSWTGYKG